jgi:hypothetical protein
MAMSILDAGSERESAHAVFAAWEKLRIVYNVILSLVVLSCMFRFSRSEVPSLPYLTYCMLMANVCFCLGPVVEGYLAMLGTQRRIVRIAVFSVGTLFASLLASMVIMLYSMRNF